MKEQSSPDVPGGWSSVVLFLAAVVGGGLWWLQSPLKSSRPDERDVSKPIVGQDKPSARLWQDPFEAALQNPERPDNSGETVFQDFGSKGTRTGAPNAQPSRFNLPDARAPKSKPLDARRAGENAGPTNENIRPLLVLGVMVTGSPFVDGAEWRVRSRVAVLSGLAAAEYVPVDAEHIGGFCHVGTVGPSRTQETSEKPLIIPFEWFVASTVQRRALNCPKNENANAFRNILVLWLADEWFRPDPLRRLCEIRARLKGLAEKSTVDAGAAPMRILGPWESSTLFALFKEDFDRISKDDVADMEFFSSSASADDFFVLNDPYAPSEQEFTDDEPPRKKLEDKFKNLADKTGNAAIKFHNLTCTDRRLAAELHVELKLRGIDPSKGDCVALVSEHDTFYGRGLPASFVREVEPNRQDDSAKDVQPLGSERRQVRCFTYLKGLDGKTAGHGRTTARDGELVAKPERQAPTSIEEMERPEGNSQLDYIPRLADEVEAWNRKISKPGHSLLRAIGILGSDVYDKLLLLQALRRRFPGVVFFTTDLDARLLHPRELPWTRNVIVASSYGLQLEPRIQRGVLPFRDSYQTGLFRATGAAVEDTWIKAPPPPGLDAPAPRIFEIGYEGAHDLSLSEDPSSVHPPRPALDWHSAGVPLLVAIGVVLSLGVAIWQISPLPRQLVGALGALRGGWLVLGLCVVGAIVVGWVVTVDHFRLDGEPFTVFEGISVWPSVLLRLAAAVIGFSLLFRSQSVVDRLQGELAAEFDLPKMPSNDEPARTWLTWLLSCWSSLRHWRSRRKEVGIGSWGTSSVLGNEPANSAGRVDAGKCWAEFVRRSCPGSRITRYVPAAMAYMAVAWFISFLEPPFQPYRGDWSYRLNAIAMVASLSAFVLLTICVLDATRLCTRFVDLLKTEATNWPENLLKKWSQRLNIPADHLNEYLGMRFIAMLSKAVGRLIWYPSLVLLVLMLARNPRLAHFDWPLSLWLFYGLSWAFALWSGILLRRAARNARDLELERLRRKLLAARKDQPGLANQIEQLVQEIESLDDGAFGPLTADPIVHNVILVASAIGIPSLLDHVTGK